ncbi:mannonate dehydratase [Pararhodobacter aggregans]|uniref:Mannonate dehydratase n=1 Tax=Pararhodobacter aggregans TaxID=404875 RepID=A0A2T7USG3_9RHOB|nr:mannonate dehydratase [Pararhodobacter aggregans]PTX03287.1 D-mannonate dehydratase [Pararhodobacter aggregans]PVE47592.1 mannonate dehydratase [Pararhodobacter aggregans]
MRHSWRWFGPRDLIRPEDIAQAGVQGVVSALHHVPNGRVWTPDAIAQRQAEVATASDGTPSGLEWEVVESLPVSEDIKKQKGEWRAHVAAYKTSLEHLAGAGIRVICYNFMPVLDWTRTDLRWRRPTGARTMRFDMADFAAFDIHLLQRKGAAQDFAPAVVEEAARRLAAMDDTARRALADAITMGLPGSTEAMDMGAVRDHLAEYGAISAERLRGHFIDFLSEVVPVAERLGLRLCCHPDDPPFPLLGLPRIMSTAGDYATVLGAVDSPANGMTLCSGSLGVRADNDLPAMMDRFGAKVHFLHLRNVTREADGSFFEDEHLEGETDMVALIAAVLREEARRRAQGREDCDIPMRPDHGQEIVDDLRRGGQPGYPLVGRLRGLAELRGVERALRVTGAYA